MQRIGFIVYPGVHLLSLSALSVFEFVNLAKGKPVYAVELLSVTGGPVHGPMGLSVDTKQLGSDSYDTIMVSGGSLVYRGPLRMRGNNLYILKKGAAGLGQFGSSPEAHGRGSRGRVFHIRPCVLVPLRECPDKTAPELGAVIWAAIPHRTETGGNRPVAQTKLLRNRWFQAGVRT